MKKATLIVLALVAIGALAIAPMVLGGPLGRRFANHGFGHGNNHDFAEGFALGRLSHLRDQLELSDAQVDQIRAIVTDLREQNAPYHDQLRGGIHDIAKSLIANPNDVAGAQAKLDAQTAAENALKKNVLTATSKALNVLTPEQRTKLGELVDKRAER